MKTANFCTCFSLLSYDKRRNYPLIIFIITYAKDINKTFLAQNSCVIVLSLKTSVGNLIYAAVFENGLQLLWILVHVCGNDPQKSLVINKLRVRSHFS